MNAKQPQTRKPTQTTTTEQLRTRTGIKAGDLYMQFPRGSNN
jgi:hypothetical protein